MGGRFIYMATTSDELETPLYVTDSAREMAEYLHCSVDSMHSRISKLRTGRFKERKTDWVKIYAFPKEEDDE